MDTYWNGNANMQGAVRLGMNICKKTLKKKNILLTPPLLFSST